MKTTLRQTLGFGLVTVPLVTVLHLVKQNTPGEFIDGVVSGAVFSLVFALGAAAGRRWPAAGLPSRGAGFEVGAGVLAAASLWAALWTFWTFARGLNRPESATAIFALNCALMASTGVATAMLAAGRRTAAANAR